MREQREWNSLLIEWDDNVPLDFLAREEVGGGTTSRWLFHNVFMRGRMRQSLLGWFTMQLIRKMGIGKGTVFHRWNNYYLEGVISVCSLYLFPLRRRQSSEAAWQGRCHLSTSYTVYHLDSDDHSILMLSQRNHREDEPIPPWFGDVTWSWG